MDDATSTSIQDDYNDETVFQPSPPLQNQGSVNSNNSPYHSKHNKNYVDQNTETIQQQDQYRDKLSKPYNNFEIDMDRFLGKYSMVDFFTSLFLILIKNLINIFIVYK